MTRMTCSPAESRRRVRVREGEQPTVVGVRRIGTSVKGRRIRAYRLGDPGAEVRAVVLGSMHGNEKAGTRVVDALRAGAPVAGVDPWVVPTINPDGAARNTRGNARGVDLNRNFGHRWAPLSGSYYSGPRAWSEPESRALRRFLDDVRPRFVVSFHQPLHGVGRDRERPAFQRRLARGLGLPIKSFDCSGGCHGTMTSWHNANHPGTAITVEFGSSPGRRYLRRQAVRGTLEAVLGSR
jgi:protein MpaA